MREPTTTIKSKKTVIDLELPKLYLAQRQVANEARRFNVLACGRRWGKTQLGMDRVIRKALDGQPAGWFAPSYKMLMDAWRELCKMLDPIVTDKSESEKRLQLRSGGVIECWSMDSAGDSARGRRYATVVIDEAALVPDLAHAWQSSIRPMLADLKGSAWFLSTPRGMNDFKRLYDRGQDVLHRNWKSFQMPTSLSPIVSAEEIEEAKQDLTEAAFNQEFLAQFVSWEGAVFRNLLACATASVKDGPEAGHEYVIGCDWGRSNDYTVFTVLDVSTHAMVAMDRMRQIDYVQQRGRLQVLHALWKPRRIIAELNSIGQPLFEELQRARLPVEGFTTTNASKAEAIDALALAFEKGDIWILNDPVLMGELQAYTAENLPSGALRYAAPGGGHDDCVISLAMAWGCVSGPLRVRMHPLFDIWHEQYDEIKEQNRPGRIVVTPSVPLADEHGKYLAAAQKRESGFMDYSFPMRRTGPAAPVAGPICTACGNPHPAQYGANSWSCHCGASGSTTEAT